MAKLSLKTLERNKLPFGKFKFMVLLKRDIRRPTNARSNAGEIEELRDMLRSTCKGSYKLVHELNYRKKRVYTHLYLTDAMDLAMLKLAHQSKLHKLYKITLKQASES